MMNFDQLIAKIPKDQYLKNHPMKSYINNIKNKIDNSFPFEQLVFILKKENILSSPIGCILPESQKIVFLGCGYCLSDNQIYDFKNGILKISGENAIPISHKISDLDDISYEADKFLFFCPHCGNLIDKLAKEVGFVSDPETILTKDEIEEIRHQVRSS